MPCPCRAAVQMARFDFSYTDVVSVFDGLRMQWVARQKKHALCHRTGSVTAPPFFAPHHAGDASNGP